MTSVFADTSFYVAVLNPQDASHTPACEISRSYRGKAITTDAVLLEVGNWLSRTGDRALFVQLIQQLRSDPKTTIMPLRRELFDQGVQLFSERLDKNWSLTDCVSF